MEYIDHAKREFLKAGYKPIEEAEDGPNKWIQVDVLELLQVLSKQGHSGFSINYVLSYFSALAKFEPLPPLTYDIEGHVVPEPTKLNKAAPESKCLCMSCTYEYHRCDANPVSATDYIAMRNAVIKCDQYKPKHFCSREEKY